MEQGKVIVTESLVYGFCETPHKANTLLIAKDYGLKI
jgi:hypothetical protein